MIPKLEACFIITGGKISKLKDCYTSAYMVNSCG